MKQWRYALILVLLVGAAFIASCRHNMAQTDSSSPKRDINAVLADNDKRLLAIPGVVGVYVGVLDDRQTSCLKVMLAEETPEAKRGIPRTIEGYLVVTQITGEIRPLGKPQRVRKEDCSSVTIHGQDTAPTPTGFAEIVRDDLAVLHSEGLCVFCSPHSNDKISLAYEQAGELKQW